jgi:enamine deaminase RidA (YjgF/YER057c/UK114 family)
VAMRPGDRDRGAVPSIRGGPRRSAASSKRAGSGFTCGVPGRFRRAPLDPFWRFVGEVEVMSSPNSQIQIRLGRNGGPVPRHAIPKVADARPADRRDAPPGLALLTPARLRALRFLDSIRITDGLAQHEALDACPALWYWIRQNFSETRMSNVSQTIQRFEPTPMLPGLPRINHVVIHGDIVYLAGITLLQALPVAALSALVQPGGGGAASLGDVADQTRRICARIDELLATAGTSKAKLLTAQVWLTDMKHFAAHNDAWNEWVDPDNAPVRACVVSPQLVFPGLLVEIMVTAAR